MLFLVNKRAVSKFSVTILAATCLSACGTGEVAQADPTIIPATGPAVWTMSDEDTTVHLFGFTQVLKPGVAWQSAAYKNALETSDTVLLETHSDDPQEQAAMQQTVQKIGLYSDGQTLTSVLSSEEAEEIGAVTQSIGLPLAGLNPLKPWLASIQLGVISITKQGYDLAHPPAGDISQTAEASDKTIESLEGPTHLMEKIAALPEDEQVKMLVHSVRTLRDDPDQMERLNAAWLQGDVPEIGEILHGEGGAWSSDLVYKTMLVDRNKAWRDQIKKRMETETGTIFVAVGLGHLAGKDSLVNMLEAEGYVVTRE